MTMRMESTCLGDVLIASDDWDFQALTGEGRSSAAAALLKGK